MVYCDERHDAANSPEQDHAVHAAHVACTLEGRARGVTKAGDCLHPSSTATTVRVPDRKTRTSRCHMRKRKSNWAAVTCWIVKILIRRSNGRPAFRTPHWALSRLGR